jgi:glyoxylate reductase
MPQWRWYDPFLSLSSIFQKYDNTRCEGYDRINVDTCLRHKIALTYTPDPVTGATTDLTIFLLLSAIRKLNPELLALRKSLFKTGVDFGHDPKEKTFGILGMGRIGRAVAQRALPFGMNIICHNRRILP